MITPDLAPPPFGWIVGTLTVTLRVALIHSGHAIGDPFAALGSVTVLADTLLFGWLVIRRQQGVSAPTRPA